jgi:hypothetical protein
VRAKICFDLILNACGPVPEKRLLSFLVGQGDANGRFRIEIRVGGNSIPIGTGLGPEL